MRRLGPAAVALLLLTVAATSTASAEKRVASFIGNKDHEPDAAWPSVRPVYVRPQGSTWRILE
jgi:hypothetical protein